MTACRTIPGLAGAWVRIVPSLAAILLVGCVAPRTRLNLIDVDEEGRRHRFTEEFDEAYFDIDTHGNLDLVLRRVYAGRMSDELDLTQVVHVQSVWRSLPGTTIADDDQINATVNYALLGAAAGHTFEGAGSVFFQLNKRGKLLTGDLGRAIVKPSRRVSPTAPLFSRVELSGRFRAKRDARQVKLIKNDLRRVFGPHPAG